MYRLVDNRKALLVCAIVVAFVAIVIPTCRMVGCSMDMGSMGSMGMLPMGTHSAISSSCDGVLSTTEAPLAIIPVGLEALALALLGAFMALAPVVAQQSASRPAPIAHATPPPPPEDPLGVRFRV